MQQDLKRFYRISNSFMVAIRKFFAFRYKDIYYLEYATLCSTAQKKEKRRADSKSRCQLLWPILKIHVKRI